MRKYPKEYLEEIKLRLKVSQVVGKHVQLKKRGKEFVGLSPFKNEKTPSFTVSDEKGFYHCFSTGEHGNIFDFLMKTQSLGFGESVKKLAAEAGLQPYRFTPVDEKKQKRYEIYKDIFKSYVLLCHKNLLENKENLFALNYLRKRLINIDTLTKFKIGYVSNKENLFEILSKNYSVKDLESTGLFFKSDKNNKHYERFNSRIIFPINNLSGDTIALGGRTIDNERLAKYINSPETEFFKKGNLLFNLDKAKDFRTKTNDVVIVEGYMDVLSLYQNGVTNVISNSGTALTERQIELVWKFFSNPIICLDGDTSGQNAAKRISERVFPLISDNKKVFFSVLNESQDPDDFIKKEGKEKFLLLLKQKISIEDYIWNINFNKINKSSPYEISKFEKEIRKLCYQIKDEVLRKHILEIYLNYLNNLTPRQKNPFFSNKLKSNPKLLNETKEIYNRKQNLTAEALKEFSILYLMLKYPKIIKNNLNEISSLKFISNDNENLKNDLILALSDKEKISLDKILLKYDDLIKNINFNVNISAILRKKTEAEIVEILRELITELKDLKNLGKLESFEKKLLNKFDESSYSELLKLKTQLNRE